MRTALIIQLLINVITISNASVNDGGSNHKENAENSEKQANCSCLPYYQCSEESGSVITDGEGLLDLRGLDDHTCTGYFDVCCNVTIVPNLRPTHPIQAPVNHAGDSDQGCGFLKQMLVPWSGILLLQTAAGGQKWDYKCGISIIHARIAITAAHCIPPDTANQRLQVKVAESVTPVTKVVPHPRYNSGTLQNDIALLVLEKELDHVGTICIPPPGSHLLERQCNVATWKKNGKLRIIEVPLVPHQKCEHLLRKTRLGKYFQLHLSFVCAGGNSFQDACDGDGGSPLICPVPGQPGRYHQVGIVSWGIGCGEKDTPGVYVNVASFRNWIDEVVQSEVSVQNGGALDGINSYRY